MKLRAVFPHRQLLFGFLFCAAGLCGLAGRQASADVYYTRDGQPHEAKILGCTGTTLQVVIAAGQMGVPLATVVKVDMPPPPEFAAVQKLASARDYAKLLGPVRVLAEKFKGLPTEWAQRASAMHAEALLNTGDLEKAEAAYKDYQKFYPGAGSLQSEVGMARIALSKNNVDEAKKKLEPIAASALVDKAPSSLNAAAYSHVFLALGQIKEKEGDKSGALESYLRTVALFAEDSGAVASAQELADKLIEQNVVTP